MLSEALQTIAGTLIRRVINALTTNRLMALGVGTFVTTLVQSSSVTTVMVVGFVNAGLMDLTQALGVVFGANIGTTITGWIIAIKVGKYGLLFVALGMIPVMFSKNPHLKSVGRLCVALGFVFMGLQYMSSAFKPLRGSETFLAMLQYFTADSYATLFACIAVGAVLTFIIQSSSAMLGITIALAASGVITFQTSVALVLGENIGTTITAWLASLGMNTNAKRAARGHIFFNVLGVLWISMIFWFYIDIVDNLIAGDPDRLSPDGSKPLIAAHIAAGHTLFNVVNSLLFLPFLSHLARFVTKITPAKEEKEIPKLEFIPGMTPNMAIAAAQKQLSIMGDITLRMIAQAREYVLSKKLDGKLAEKVNHYEDVTDNIQAEITHFLIRTQEAKMTPETSNLASALIRAADELESIADYASATIRYRDRLEQKGLKLSTGAKSVLEDYSARVETRLTQLLKAFDSGEDLASKEEMLKEDEELITDANKIRETHMKRLQEGKEDPSAGMVFSDLIVAYRKIRAHTTNFQEALAHTTPE